MLKYEGIHHCRIDNYIFRPKKYNYLEPYELFIDKDGKDIMIGFNPKFFIDALRVIDEEEVNLYMVNPKAPCFIKDDEGKFIYLILPVNFNTAAN